MATTFSQHVSSPDINRYVVAESWGQPPASQYRFRLEGTRMYGTPMPNAPASSRHQLDRQVYRELLPEQSLWEFLSDEALLDFENGLD